MSKNLNQAILNFFALSALLAIIILPILFAKNFGKVAGVKFEQNYILISQIENFPGFSFNQQQNTYSLTFNKHAPTQAFLSVLKIYNPQSTTATYEIKINSQSNRIFFGEDLDNLNQTITVPSGATASISLLSTGDEESVQFKIEEI